MITLQYGQEVLFITNEGKELDCYVFDHCLEEEFKELADGYEAIENKLNEIIER